MTDIGLTTLGEYRGDVTRDTFAPSRHIRRVITQQGRAVLDADLNEQSAIVLHYLQSLARDLGGPHFGRGDAFKVDSLTASQAGASIDFKLGRGNYYVGGVLCETGNVDVSYLRQPFSSSPTQVKAQAPGAFLVYLDVWERHLTHVHVPAIREVALGQLDTAARSQIVWQLKLLELGNLANSDLDRFKPQGNPNAYAAFLEELKKHGSKPGSGLLRARVNPAAASELPCSLAPESRYRGLENQLYRVEIHRSGATASGGGATFKWSRENSSATYPIRTITGAKLSLSHLGRDARFTLKPLDWVEIVDDDQTLSQTTSKLQQVKSVDREDLSVTLAEAPSAGVGHDTSKHPFLRRWDQRKANADDNAAQVVTSASEWLPLEDGIEVQFAPGENNAPLAYESGDFWLIPARVATGDVEWQRIQQADQTFSPLALVPHGAAHYYAPLAAFVVSGIGADSAITTSAFVDCRVPVA